MSTNIEKQLPCELVNDLLPLYADEICSEISKRLVEEHVEECENCKTELATIKNDVFQENSVNEKVQSCSFTMKKAMKKVRMKWALSIAATITVMLMGVVIACEVTGTGIELKTCYESMMNIGNYIKVRGLEKSLMKNDFSDVFDYMNIDEMYNQMQNEMVMSLDGQDVMVKEMEFDTFKELCKQKFVSELDEFIKKGYQINEVECINTKRIGGQNSVKLAITYENTGEEQQYTEFWWIKEVNNKFIYQEYGNDLQDQTKLKNIFSFEIL